jgi:hypothetical protein
VTLRDPGYDYDGCPECGAGVRESVRESDERGRLVYRCKEDPELCGWSAEEPTEQDEQEDDDGR